MAINTLPLQEFDWTVSKTEKGSRIKIISTFESTYSDKQFSQRVASGDIALVRLKDNEVELKIAEAQTQDGGFYWCQTLSTDSISSGNYEAAVQLIGMGCVCMCVCQFCPFKSFLFLVSTLSKILLVPFTELC